MDQRGQTALIITVPEAEPAVRAWRERFDPSVRTGVPAHITVHFPFLHHSRIDARTGAALAAALREHRPFTVRFTTCGRFPGVLYLAPEPETELRQLTQSIADRWPEVPPFEGRFTDIVPHLTVAQDQPDDVLDEIEAGLLGDCCLPVTAHIESVKLMVHDGTLWRERRTFALDSAPQ